MFSYSKPLGIGTRARLTAAAGILALTLGGLFTPATAQATDLAMEDASLVQADTLLATQPVDGEPIELTDDNLAVVDQALGSTGLDDATATVDADGSSAAEPETPADTDETSSVPNGDATDGEDAATNEDVTDSTADNLDDAAAQAATSEQEALKETDAQLAPEAALAPTSDETELSAGSYRNQWVYDGSLYYYYDETGSKKTGWHIGSVTPLGNKGELQRYWLDTTTGALAVHRLISASEAGWWAYARPYGRIVRGKYIDPNTGYVYLADNNGKLENPGWLVASGYGDGLQRYYVDATEHACVPGYSTDGWAHYTTNAGYVLRGGTTEGGVKRIANNDGRLTNGWVVSRDLGQGLQRYWQQDGSIVTSKLIQTGPSSWAYARPEGYVVRGVYQNSANGFIYLANNDGRLENAGWLVTNAYHGEWQRYYINATSHAAQPGFFTAVMPGRGSATGVFFTVANKGYVSRGKTVTGYGVLLSNNEGILVENDKAAGWACTSAYDSSIQRYYLESFEGHLYAKTGFFEMNSKTYYALPTQGYCMRGKLASSNGVLLADNDAVLVETNHSAGWLVIGTYDGGYLQRYYLCEANGHLYAKTGFFAINKKSYCGDANQGYVARNVTLSYKGAACTANNDGVLRYLMGVQVTVPTVTDGDPLRVLLIGNSFTYYNNGLISSMIAQLTGAEVVTRAVAAANLHDYVTSASNVGTQVISDLNQGGWDFVVIQEQSTRAIDNYSGYLSDLSNLAQRARNGGATPVIYATWAYNGDGSVDGASQRGISLQTMNQQLQSAFSRAAASISAPISNVGQAFANRGYSSSLYSSDSKHPSSLGSELAGQIIARTISSLL